MTTWLCLPSSPSCPPQTHQIRPRAHDFLPRDRPTELVNRPSLAPSHGRHHLPPICVYADAAPVSRPVIDQSLGEKTTYPRCLLSEGCCASVFGSEAQRVVPLLALRRWQPQFCWLRRRCAWIQEEEGKDRG